MDKKLLVGFVLGIFATYVYNSSIKKPCGCNGKQPKASEPSTVPENGLTDAEISECEQAVKLVMDGLRKTTKMTAEQYGARFESELKKCIEMSKT